MAIPANVSAEGVATLMTRSATDCSPMSLDPDVAEALEGLCILIAAADVRPMLGDRRPRLSGRRLAVVVLAAPWPGHERLDITRRWDEDRVVTTTAETAEATDEQSSCWCCGVEYAEEELVHLGSHPEVGLCADCALWVHRRAAEAHAARRGGPGSWYRRTFRRTTDWVMKHDLQNRPGIGGLLRRLNRFLP